METEEIIKHISDKIWSAYKESDYSLQQWHDACLIHLHDSGDYTKADCKLPVKTPNGVINRNGVHAAWAALAGARGGVDAPEEEKRKAAKRLVSLYKQIGDEPPTKMMSMAQSTDMVSNFLEHHGIKGQKWGIRRERKALTSGKKGLPTKKHEDYVVNAKNRKKKVSELSNEDIRKANERADLENNFRKKNPGKIDKGHAHVVRLLAIAGTAGTAYNFSQSPLGKKVLSGVLKSNGTKTVAKYGTKIVIKEAESFI